MQTKALPGAIGTEVIGLTEADLISEATQKLRELWVEHGLLVFRGVQGATFQITLSEIFGECEVHPLRPKSLDSAPELINITYTPYGPGSQVYEVDGALVGGWLPLHFDLVYVDRVNRGGVLRPLQLPQQGGGQTIFADKITLYDEMPSSLRRRIEDKEIVYRLDLDISHMRFTNRRVRLAHMGDIQCDIMARATGARVIHPAVYAQSETGRRMLNVSPWFAEEVVGLPARESDELLREVVAHIEGHGRTYAHHWRADDMVLWDNWRMLHGATGVAPDDTRRMQRTTIRGDYALGRLEAPDAQIIDVMRINV